MKEIVVLDKWEKFLALPPSEEKSCSVYRGVPDQKWGFETTLERAGRANEPFEEYHRTAEMVARALESDAGPHRAWQALEHDDFSALSSLLENDVRLVLPNYEILIGLKHLGMPSPFLDWTRSRYIAAYFAFAEADPARSERCAIYEFSRFGGDGVRVFSGNRQSPRICSPAPLIRAPRQHHLQQMEYTYCIKGTGQTGLVFAPHREGQGGYVKKYTLPASEKAKALNSLQEMNISAFSLFGTDESLVRTLAAEHYLLRNFRMQSAAGPGSSGDPVKCAGAAV